MDTDLDKCYEEVMKLVDEAGEIISNKSNDKIRFDCKSADIDLLTETDQEVEKHLINGLIAKFPTHKFIGEEESSAGKKSILTDDPTWVIDPIDGTMNFVHNFPHCSISIALIVNKITEIGIVYNPVIKQKFTARRGHGAFYNGKRMHVSEERELCKALITSEFGTSRDLEKMAAVNANFAKLSSLAHGFRCLGSAALNMSMVALGAADANYEMGIHIWDIAAGDLLVREAGGVTIDPSGGVFDIMSRRILVAATNELAQAISKELVQHYPKPRDD